MRYQAGAIAGVDVGNAALAPRALRLTCPLSLTHARSNGIAAEYVAPPSRAGTRARVALQAALPLAYQAATLVVEGGRA